MKDTIQNPYPFDAAVTNKVKGFGVILLLWFHLFYMEAVYKIPGIQITPLFLNQHLFMEISKTIGVCTQVFIFATAYGLAVKLNTLAKNPSGVRQYLFERLIRLISGYQFIYVISLIICSFSTIRNPIAVYGPLNQFKTYIHILIDAFGLSHLFSMPTLNPTWWYITPAVGVILFAPLFHAVYERFGALSLLLALFLMYSFGISPAKYAVMRFFFPIPLAILFADRQLFGKMRLWSPVKNIFVSRTIKTVIFFGANLLFMSIYHYIPYISAVTNSFWVIVICYGIYTMNIPWVSGVLLFLGKRSMNIFMTHTFIFLYFAQKEIYSFRYPILIFFALLAASLLISELLTFAKKVLIGLKNAVCKPKAAGF